MGITSPSEQHFDKGLWGWTGSVWAKLAMLFGYTSRWAERVTDQASGVETIDVTTTVVPAGYIYVLQACSAINVGSACASVLMRVLGGGAYCGILYQGTPIIAAPDCWSGEIVLAAGDSVTARFVTCADGDNCYLDVRGYKMAVA